MALPQQNYTFLQMFPSTKGGKWWVEAKWHGQLKWAFKMLQKSEIKWRFTMCWAWS
jgi:hypothetical protein